MKITAQQTRQMAASLRDHLRLPLFRNGYALMLGAAATSGLGVVYWLLAARLYSAEALGFNSALLSAVTLIAGIAQLSLNGVLVRFIPVAGTATGRLIVRIYIASAVTAVLIALIFGLTAQRWSPTLAVLSQQPLFLLLFVLATAAWSIFSLQDSALTGLRQALWIPLENGIFAVLKIVLLVAWASSFAAYGVLASWAVPVLLSLVPVNWLIFRRLLPTHVLGYEGQTLPLRRPILTYITGNYPGWLFFLSSTTLLPIIVADIVGNEAAAYFYLPWTIASTLLLVTVNFCTSLTVEATVDQEQLQLYAYKVLLQAGRIVLPAALALAVGAPLILRLFGADYMEKGSMLLRLLALAAIPNIVVVIFISLARVDNSVLSITVVQGAICLLTLGLSYLLMPTMGILGVGVAWLTAQISAALVLLLTRMGRVFHVGRAAQLRERGAAAE